MPFGFGKKDEYAPFKTNLKDGEDLEEIKKISHTLAPDEEVLFVAKQLRNIPGGAIISSPNTVFATDKRLVIKNPTMLGLRENMESIPYDKITSVKLEKGLFSSTVVIRSPGLSELSRMSNSSGLIAWGRGEDGSIDGLPKEKAEVLVRIIKERMEMAKNAQTKGGPNQLSVADELTKLANLKQQGILTEEEFAKMKQDLINKMSR